MDSEYIKQLAKRYVCGLEEERDSPPPNEREDEDEDENEDVDEV